MTSQFEISAVMHEGLSVTVNGRPAKLAVVLDDGTVVAAGKEVAEQATSVSQECLRQFWIGRGHMRVVNNPAPILPSQRAA